MSSAKLYVSTNVVDRLTRPIQPPATDDSGQAFDLTYGGDRTVMDIASFMGALQQGGAGGQVGSGGSVAQGTHKAFQTPNHANGARTAVESAGGTGQRLRRPSSAPRERSNSFSGTGGVGAGGPIGNRDSKVVIPKEQFQQFLGRQEQSLIRKDNHVKEVRIQLLPDRLMNRRLAFTRQDERSSPMIILFCLRDSSNILSPFQLQFTHSSDSSTLFC